MRGLVLSVVAGVGLAASVAFVGCASNPGTTPTDASVEPVDGGPPTQYDSSFADAFAPLDPARLVQGPVTYKDKTGKAISDPAGWTDKQRSEVCAPMESTDGAFRCLPLEGAAPWRDLLMRDTVQTYADPACSFSQAAVVIDGSWKTPPKYMIAPYQSDTVQYALFSLEKSASRDVFVFDFCRSAFDDAGLPSDAGARSDAAPADCQVCRKVTVPAGSDLYVGKEIEPSKLGEFRRY